MSVKARPAKGKARLRRLEELQASGPQERDVTGDIIIPDGKPLRGLVLEGRGLRCAMGGRQINMRAYCAGFSFKGTDQQ